MTRLKFERTRRHLSQEALGCIVQMTQPEVGLVEQGRLIPTAAQLQRLATVFGVPAARLLQPMAEARSRDAAGRFVGAER